MWFYFQNIFFLFVQVTGCDGGLVNCDENLRIIIKSWFNGNGFDGADLEGKLLMVRDYI